MFRRVNALNKTPFFAQQESLGGRFVPFAGFEMPVQFAGVVDEHRAVRSRCGIFDVSHMGEVVIEGPQAMDAVQMLITNDAGRIQDGQALYTVMCRADGGIVDDLIVYRDSETRFFLVINAACRSDDVEHMRTVMGSFDCAIDDQSDRWCLLALQGPHSAEILSRVTDLTLGDLKPFHFVEGTVGGVESVRVSRTGYTGEDGFELYCPWETGPQLWSALFEAEPELSPCGLGARDTLRLEMKYPLYGNDIDLERNPYEAGLGWTVRLAKSDFVGRDALERVKADGPSQRWIGFRMEGRGIPRSGYPIRVGELSGVVTSGTHSPSLEVPIGVGYVPSSLAAVNQVIAIEIRGKEIPARIVKTPFLERSHR